MQFCLINALKNMGINGRSVTFLIKVKNIKDIS